jgi:hypothetical protein
MFTLRDLLHGIPLKQLLEGDKKIWTSSLRVGDTVLAGKSKPTVLSISQRGVFLCLSYTGSFTTLFDDGGAAGDNGVCALSMKSNNNNGRVYFPEPIFLHNLFTPGRVKDVQVPAGTASNSLQFPGMEFVTVFRPSDQITHVVQNDATFDNSWEMAYHGVWISE